MFSRSLLKSWGKGFDKGLKSLAVLFLEIYRSFLSGLWGSGGCCRFYPSCGEYALLSYKKHSFLKASRLVLFRLLSCHPLGPKWRDEEN